MINYNTVLYELLNSTKNKKINKKNKYKIK